MFGIYRYYVMVNKDNLTVMNTKKNTQTDGQRRLRLNHHPLLSPVQRIEHKKKTFLWTVIILHYEFL